MLDRIKKLFRNLAIYGFGDVATSIVSLLLLPIYTQYLTPSDYGVIAMLLTIEAVAKVLFRWGVDTAFMRLYYDCADQPARQRLASTIFFFLLAVNGSLLAVGLARRELVEPRLFGSAHRGAPHRAGHRQHIRRRLLLHSVPGSADQGAVEAVHRAGVRALGCDARSASGARHRRRHGRPRRRRGRRRGDRVLHADPEPLVRAADSSSVLTPMLREALRFGLPRIPHSVAHQVIGLADRYFLNAFGTLHDVGLYSIGASFGLALKLFVGAFEAAWTPFFLGVMREPDPQRIYATVSTYVVAVLVLLTAGLCAVAADVVRLTTTAEFHEAARVTPWIALGVMFQGAYIVGSIGLVITKRTTRYPLATGGAAAASLLANAWLIPRYGLMGAAWANTLAVRDACGRDDHVLPAALSDSLRMEPAVADRRGRTGRVCGEQSTRAGIPVTVAGNCAARSPRHGTYLAVLYATGSFTPGSCACCEMFAAGPCRGRAHNPPPVGSESVEMAGEIVASAEEPGVVALEIERSARRTRRSVEIPEIRIADRPRVLVALTDDAPQPMQRSGDLAPARQSGCCRRPDCVTAELALDELSLRRGERGSITRNLERVVVVAV